MWGGGRKLFATTWCHHCPELTPSSDLGLALGNRGEMYYEGLVSSPGSASSFLCPSLRMPTYKLGMTCSLLLISGVCEDWEQADGEALVTGTCYQNVTFGFKE